MKEEIIVSGRLNPNIDPVLHIWHWQIPLYLFLGGMAAGILFFAAYFTLRNKAEEYPTVVRKAPLIVPVLLVLGLIFLFLDLKHKLYFWRLYTTIRIQSPMSWGAWVLMAITPASFIWAAMHITEIFPRWKWKYTWIDDFLNFFRKNMQIFAWAVLLLAVILGVYTGILFSAFNARPLWSTSILGPLFLASGLSSGAAYIVLISKNKIERHRLSMIDMTIIVIELFLITHMFMGMLAGTQIQIETAKLFLGGKYTVPLWLFVIFFGLVLPLILEVLELRKKHFPKWIVPILVLIGGLLLRFIIAQAGQESRWLY